METPNITESMFLCGNKLKLYQLLSLLWEWGGKEWVQKHVQRGMFAVQNYPYHTHNVHMYSITVLGTHPCKLPTYTGGT